MADQQFGGDSKDFATPKLSTRDILASLSERRILLEDIHFHDGSKQASGGYGDVELATLAPKTSDKSNPGEKVAVKKQRFDTKDSNEVEKLLKAFTNEFQILDGLSHPNIIEVRGFVEDVETKIAWIITPWEANGNVREFLLAGEWDIPERMSLIQDVSFGLDYLHSRNPPICHGDLKSLNILVNSLYRAVITDFGSARVLGKDSRTVPNQSNFQPTPDSEPTCNDSLEVVLSASEAILTLTGPSVSFRWASPELLDGGKPDLASDVWALGWICWEPSVVPADKTAGNAKLRSIALVLELGELYKLGGRYDEAWTAFNDALAIARSTGNECMSGDALLAIGELQLARSKHSEAKEALSQALSIFRHMGDGRRQSQALRRLALVHQMLYQYTEVEECLNEVLTSPEDIVREEATLDAWHLLGEAQQARLKWDLAEKSFSEALQLSSSLESDRGIANAYYSLGELYRAQERYVDAEVFLNKASAGYESIGENLGYANCLQALGQLQVEVSRFEEARKSLNKAFERYRSLGNDLGQACVLGGIGHLDLAQSRLDDAEDSYIRALEMYGSVGNDKGRASILFGIGTVHLERSKYSEAESPITEALELYTIGGDDVCRISTLYLLARLRTHQGRYAEAMTLISSASWMAAELDYDAGMSQASYLFDQVREAEAASTKLLPSSPDQIRPQEPSGDTNGGVSLPATVPSFP